MSRCRCRSSPSRWSPARPLHRIRTSMSLPRSPPARNSLMTATSSSSLVSPFTPITVTAVVRLVDLLDVTDVTGWRGHGRGLPLPPSAKKVNRTMSRHLVRSVPFVVASVVGALVLAPAVASANVAVTQVSTDPFTDAQAQHRTEVEPDTFAFGNTIVSAFQVGRVSGGGASNIGFATSTNGGATWTQGFLPGITGNAGGPCGQASDAAVAFDARHNVWLISSLGVNCPNTPVFTSRS